MTNLNRFEFPIKKMKELYHLRWGEETSFKELKYALSAVQFHSRKDDFVDMELLTHLTMFNAVSRSVNRVEVPQSADRKYDYVVSFKDAVTIVRKYFRLFCNDPPERLFAELLCFTVWRRTRYYLLKRPGYNLVLSSCVFAGKRKAPSSDHV